MKTHNGNIGKIYADIGKITFDTLDKFNIPYDEIYFGKPYADIYIDDNAINCFDDIEKLTGYYLENIEPRSFNELKTNTINIYEKKANDLSGQIYYYKNIPIELKDLFPLFIDYDKDNKWYKMEQIIGVSVTQLYISELLTTHMLSHIMNSINRIHNNRIDNNIENINIYENYCNKLQKRYKKYDYSKFKNSNKIYNDLYNELMKYENEKNGKLSVIHGDTVMTNILINKFGKIKFIDMTGKLGDKLTIYGDEIYDWAKLYQSLIGYDKILMDKTISEKYEKNIIDFFINQLEKQYNRDYIKTLKTITKSLLFSLIPLHDNEKCYKYYDLIMCEYLEY
jgi:aminoglycoside phosphotransferase